jgi:hypothetical protein
VHLLEDLNNRLAIVHQDKAKASVGRQIEQVLVSAKRAEGLLA